MAIGGAAGPSLLARFVELAGGPDAAIVVIATASANPADLEAVLRRGLHPRSAPGRYARCGWRPAPRPTTPSVERVAGRRHRRLLHRRRPAADHHRARRHPRPTRCCSRWCGRRIGGARRHQRGRRDVSGTMILGGDGPGSPAVVRTGPGLDPARRADRHALRRARPAQPAAQRGRPLPARARPRHRRGHRDPGRRRPFRGARQRRRHRRGRRRGHRHPGARPTSRSPCPARASRAARRLHVRPAAAARRSSTGTPENGD